MYADMFILFFSIIAVAVAADQITKYIISANFEVGESLDVIKGVFRFTYVRNEGAAFGMLANHRWVFLLLSSVAIAAIIFYFIKYRPESKWTVCALALITSGGIGNMIDRIRLKYVIDMCDFYAFGKYWKWVFNLADACVCVGAVMLALWLLSDTVAESRREKTVNNGNDAKDGNGNNQ